MANTNCTCGAAKVKHPATGYSEQGACLVALEASNVRCACDWPGCGKKVRKTRLGKNMCAAHRKADWNAFMTICAIEGPAGLNRPTPTTEELEYMHRAGEMPASRLAPVALKDSHIHCADCHGKMLVFNPSGWKAGDPDVVNYKPVGIGICPKCSFEKQAVA